jgi:hypothetical protein
MVCKADEGSICLPGSEIPNWFSHQADEGVSLCHSGRETPIWFSHTKCWWSSHYQTMASLISFHVPSFLVGKIGKMLLCVVFAANKEDPSRVGNLNWRLRNKTRTHQANLKIGSKPFRVFGSCEDHIFLEVCPLMKCQTSIIDPQFDFEMKSGDEIEVSVEFACMSMDRSEELKSEIQVKKCGIHLLVDDPNVVDTRGDETKRFVVDKQEFTIYAEDEGTNWTKWFVF